ncbi:unnamed protein product [Phytomonas sp. Hart1]|nr:unnamed protein product [Phytomonas sp. Hart1]|eukprot:CCW71959.1 unnamed protein product [Phytomonas sp. isolate Hart1]
MSDIPVLLEFGAKAHTYQAQVNEVKDRLGIKHDCFDSWLYTFPSSANFNVERTVRKLIKLESFK